MSAETASLEQIVIEKLRELPVEKQQEVADFVEFVHHRSVPKRPRRSLEGLWKGLHEQPVTEEDIAEARREMWGSYSDDG